MRPPGVSPLFFMSRPGRRKRLRRLPCRTVTPSRNNGSWWAVLATMAGLLVAPLAMALEAPTDRIIVKWRDSGGTLGDERSETQALGLRTGRRLAHARPIGGGMSLLQLERTYSAAELPGVLAQLRSDPRIALAEPDRRVRAHAYVPNDPLFAGQWYLKSVQPAAIRADAAWDLTRGGTSPAASTVVVAVIDSGVRFDHPDLRAAAAGGKLLPGYDFVSGDTGGQFLTANDGDGWDPDPTDPGDFVSQQDLNGLYAGKGCGANGSDTTPSNSSWHGTRVSGLIAADSDNALGIAGTGFHVRVLPVRALGKCGGYDSDVLAAMYWAAGVTMPAPLLVTPVPANPNPAQVINMSLGGVGPCSATYAEAVRAITAAGVLVVASAGNEGEAVESPANCAGALAVAGVRHVGTKVGYSSLGTEVGIAAPAGNCVNLTGACLFSLDTTTNSGATTPVASAFTNQNVPNVGTSFSSPLVAGAAGLMKAVNPRLTPALIMARMKASARPFPTTSDTVPVPGSCVLPSVTATQDSECLCTTAVCGAGLLDAAAAVTEALRPAAVATVSGTVGIGRTLSLDGSQSGAANGRSISSYAWSVVGTTGGATTPTISAGTQAIASVVSPSAGSYMLQLRVTDNAGAIDTAQVSVTAANDGGGTGSTAPPPTTQGSQGGGGHLSPWMLTLFALLMFAIVRRRALR